MGAQARGMVPARDSWHTPHATAHFRVFRPLLSVRVAAGRIPDVYKRQEQDHIRSFSDMAILYRTHRQGAVSYTHLDAKGIPEDSPEIWVL